MMMVERKFALAIMESLGVFVAGKAIYKIIRKSRLKKVRAQGCLS